MTAWHLEAVRLPDGVELRDSWLSDQGWRDQPMREAEPLPGRFALPGFVDSHSHVSFGTGADGGPVPLDRSEAGANLDRYAREGVGMIRDAGGAPNVVLTIPVATGRPHVMAAGRHLAPAGMYFEAVHDPVDASNLVAVALAEIAAGARWVKLVADFIPADARTLSTALPVPTYDLDVVRDLIQATHAAGARIAAHVTTSMVGELVRLGIDSVEHGTGLDHDTIAEMARRGTAWTPTLCAGLSIAPDAPDERRRLVHQRRERFCELLPLAIELGASVLTGSDVVGSIPREIALLVECGVDPSAALRAATTTAVQFFGTDAAAAMPSVVTFDADPRSSPQVLSQPVAIVVGGQRIL